MYSPDCEIWYCEKRYQSCGNRDLKSSLQIAVIGRGAIAQHVYEAVQYDNQIHVAAFILRVSGDLQRPQFADKNCVAVASVDELPAGIDVVVDCGGHSGLMAQGQAALVAGIDVVTISSGAFADEGVAVMLADAAVKGKARLKILSGAIGGVDVLAAGNTGELTSVMYVGRKPPMGWIGSPAEEKCDLGNLKEPFMHFQGTAREAAILYPKNANVAATVALAGVGFDQTEVKLIADPLVTRNIHEILAEGSFGSLQVKIEGNPLAGNPKSSALAAMSIVSELRQRCIAVGF